MKAPKNNKAHPRPGGCSAGEPLLRRGSRLPENYTEITELRVGRIARD